MCFILTSLQVAPFLFCFSFSALRLYHTMWTLTLFEKQSLPLSVTTSLCLTQWGLNPQQKSQRWNWVWDSLQYYSVLFHPERFDPNLTGILYNIPSSCTSMYLDVKMWAQHHCVHLITDVERLFKDIMTTLVYRAEPFSVGTELTWFLTCQSGIFVLHNIFLPERFTILCSAECSPVMVRAVGECFMWCSRASLLYCYLISYMLFSDLASSVLLPSCVQLIC